MHKSKTNQEITTLLGKGSKFNGELSFEGAVRIDGFYQGKITSKNAVLIIGQEGIVDGSISIKELIIQGKFSGSAEVFFKTHINKTAKFDGELKTKFLVVEEGALFNGECKMDGSEPIKPKR